MLAMAYVLVLAIVALEIPLALSLRQRIDEEVRLQARGSADLVAVLAHEVLDKRTDADLQSFLTGPARQARGRIVVVDDSGEVIADSAGRVHLGDDLSTRPEIKSALSGKTVQISRKSKTLSRDLLATAVPVVDDGKAVGAVRVTQDVAAENNAFRRAVAGLVLVGIAVLSVGLMAGAVIARQFARPLRRFEGTARAVAEGDLEARAPVEGSTEQQSLARTFNEMTDRLSHSLRSQSRFVADASHQLRTPLTGLRLRLEEARARTKDNAVAVELDHGLHEVDRLARTVEELLLLSQTGERDARAESIDLGDVVERAASRWRPYAEADDHSIVVDRDAAAAAESNARPPAVGAADAAARVVASRADLDRLLDALIENALKYSPPGSNVHLFANGRSITVRDHGPGLAEGEGEELFERFHRGHSGASHSESTGLGLAIARELAHRWGAEVSLRNADGGGAQARVAFGPGFRTGSQT
ncbi:MAG: HAMP domain-containing protein [Actinobacteria bacterium]|nr:HAMP domain-containing protein [Actinomycetota bacterium]